jgi:hypothetical protein
MPLSAMVGLEFGQLQGNPTATQDQGHAFQYQPRGICEIVGIVAGEGRIGCVERRAERRSKKNRRRRSDMSRAACSFGSPAPVLPARCLGLVPTPEVFILRATRKESLALHGE